MRISDWSSDVCSSDLTTYKAQIDQQQSRGQTLQAEINVLIAKYNEEAKKTPQNQAALQAAAKAVQDKRQAAQQEQIGRARVGKECVSTCRSRWSQYHSKKTKPN